MIGECSQHLQKGEGEHGKGEVLNNLKPQQSSDKRNIHPNLDIPHLTLHTQNIIATSLTIQLHNNMGSYQTTMPLERLIWLWERYLLYTPIENHSLSPPIQNFAMEILLLINQYIKPLSRQEPPTTPFIHNHHTRPSSILDKLCKPSKSHTHISLVDSHVLCNYHITTPHIKEM